MRKKTDSADSEKQKDENMISFRATDSIFQMLLQAESITGATRKSLVEESVEKALNAVVEARLREQEQKRQAFLASGGLRANKAAGKNSQAR